MDDNQLNELLLNADVHFLPLTGLANSNAIIQSLALGLPIVITDLNQGYGSFNKEVKFLYKKDSIEHCIEGLNYFLCLPFEEKIRKSQLANGIAQDFSWISVAKRTLELYNTLI